MPERRRAEAWGSGADWLLDRAPHWVGLHDDVDGFDPSLHPKIADWARRHPGIRLPAAGVIWQELLLVLLGQRVTTEEAVEELGEDRVRVGRTGAGPVRAAAATVARGGRRSLLCRPASLQRRAPTRRRDPAGRSSSQPVGGSRCDGTPPSARTRLSALPGLGAWTATSVITATHGDPDTIVLRDYGLPTMVNYAFTGDARRLPADEGGDEIMCRHLAPWSGHRQRIVRLLFTAASACLVVDHAR